MSFKTTGGGTSRSGYGTTAWATGDVLKATDLTANLADVADATHRCAPAGRLGGPDPTASGLTVTLPAGTSYLAGVVWTADADVQVVVGGSTTTYVWGCADGQVRTTTALSPPTGWSWRSAALLAIAIAGVSAATVSTPGWGAPNTSAVAWYTPLPVSPRLIPEDVAAVIPEEGSAALIGPLSVYGQLDVYGILEVQP